MTALQRAANRIYGYTAKQTLDYAQSLYEKKLITYPRTDSRYLTEDMAKTVSTVIRLGVKIPPFDKAVPGFASEVSAMLNNSKVSDHHAITPTVQIENADTAELPNGELNILKLIICRMISATAIPYIYENITVEFECGGYTFIAKGKHIISYRFKAVEKLLASSSENEDGGDPPVNFVEGQTF